MRVNPEQKEMLNQLRSTALEINGAAQHGNPAEREAKQVGGQCHALPPLDRVATTTFG